MAKGTDIPSQQNHPECSSVKRTRSREFEYPLIAPSDEFDEFLTTDPVFLSADASDKSDPARMPLPLTDPVTKTLQTENSVAEVQPDPGYEETSSSDLPPEPENQSAGWNPSEPAPLQTDVTRWYQYPQRWIKGF